MPESINGRGSDYENGDIRTVRGDDYTYQKGRRADDALTGSDGVNNFLTGAGGDDILTGSNDKNVLVGGQGNDTLYGGDSDDWLMGGSGNDIIDGGGGQDFAKFKGGLDNYSIEIGVNGELIVTDLSGEDGEDTVINVEEFKFGDTKYTVDDLVYYAENGTLPDFDDPDLGDGADDPVADEADDPDANDIDTQGVGAVIEGTDNDEAFIADGTATDGSLPTPYDDIINTLAGNDYVYAAGGDDIVDGGEGSFDLYVLYGSRSEYEIVENEDGSITITDSVESRDDTDTVSNFEVFQFFNSGSSASEYFSRNELLTLGEGEAPDNAPVSSLDATDDILDAGTGEAGQTYFAGLISDYVITANDDGSFTFENMVETDEAAGIINQGTDTVIGAEYFIFGDQLTYTPSELVEAIQRGESNDGSA